MPDTNPAAAQVPASEAMTRLPELLDRVQRGEENVITRDGKPAARLTAAPPTHHVEAAMKAAERLIALGREIAAKADPPFTIAEILELRDAGRRY